MNEEIEKRKVEKIIHTVSNKVEKQKKPHQCEDASVIKKKQILKKFKKGSWCTKTCIIVKVWIYIALGYMLINNFYNNQLPFYLLPPGPPKEQGPYLNLGSTSGSNHQHKDQEGNYWLWQTKDKYRNDHWEKKTQEGIIIKRYSMWGKEIE